MDMKPVIDILQKRFGCTINTDYYSRVAEWREWWRGHVKSFHTYRELGIDGKSLERQLFSMHMAKKVCEDWASILLNEKTTITLADKASSEFLQGKDGTGGVLGQNDFWQCGNELVEKAFAVGTGAFLVRANGMKVGKDTKQAYKSDTAKTEIDFVEGSSIIPLSVKHKQITEAAFVSEVLDKGKKYIYLETHALDNGMYVIKNEYFCIENGVLKPQPLPAGIAEEVHTGSDRPWFAIVRPNITNNLQGSNGLGLSVFANAIDNLKGVDLAFNNFVKDFKLGGKKVFYSKEMLRTNGDGNTVTPDDVAQSLFMQVGNDMDFDAKTMVQEFNPSLRVEENKAGVQSQLDYLSFKCGLGAKHYQFNAEKVMTATEYVGSKQDLVQNASKHYILMEKTLQTLVRAILYVGKEICGQSVDPDTDITIHFEDSYIIDADSERERDRQDVRDGLRQAYEYRVRWMGEDEATAKAMVVAPEQSGSTLNFGGGG